MSDARTFYLKLYDILPVLDVYLLDPEGAAFSLTGSTAWKLLITTPDGTKLIRTMTKVGADAEGHLRYAWVATDWDAASAADGAGQYTVGGLPVPMALTRALCSMEYEVVGPGSARLTFPNDSEHRLSIRADLGQG